MFLPTAFHRFSFKSLQSLEDFFHLALLTATVIFRTRAFLKLWEATLLTIQLACFDIVSESPVYTTLSGQS
jgi:hypothetical protein